MRSCNLSCSCLTYFSFTSQATVYITVTDVNDNQPVFTVPPGGYVANISENAGVGLEVITVMATDNDLGTHMEITYAINDEGVPFQIIDPNVGVVYINRIIPWNPYRLSKVTVRVLS